MNIHDLKKCPSFPGYSVNELGEVYSHRIKGASKGNRFGSFGGIDYSIVRKLKSFKNKRGYCRVGLCVDKKSKSFFLHWIVADAFIGPRPFGMVVRHLDDNKENNHPSNIAYGTYKDNSADKKRNGKDLMGEKGRAAKLTNQQAQQVRQMRKEGVPFKVICEKYNIGLWVVERVVYNKSYIFKSVEK